MNQQFNELAGQALAELAVKGWNLQTSPFNLFTARFGELIVRHCADIAADMSALDIYEEIREHFGVEQ